MVLDVTLERMATHPKQYRAAAGRHTHTRQGHPPERSPGARKPEKKVDLAAGKKDRVGGGGVGGEGCGGAEIWCRFLFIHHLSWEHPKHITGSSSLILPEDAADLKGSLGSKK